MNKFAKKNARNNHQSSLMQEQATAVTAKGLHARNIHNDAYDFDALINASKSLAPFVKPTKYGQLSIDFADPLAVKALNQAILLAHYQIKAWDIPTDFLCPPIPGRVDYLHYIADLLMTSDKLVKGHKIKVLDIGTGANGVYPLLGASIYGWQFTATDIDPISIANVDKILSHNPQLASKINLKLQDDSQHIFNGVIAADERYDLTMCNPPFHASLAEATAGSLRKERNLQANRGEKIQLNTQAKLNFGGQKAELWCDGGEAKFLANMIKESQLFATQCLWFTSLVSKKESLHACYQQLEQVGAVTVNTIDMQQGNKQTRILAWSFLTDKQRQLWAKYRG